MKVRKAEARGRKEKAWGIMQAEEAMLFPEVAGSVPVALSWLGKPWGRAGETAQKSRASTVLAEDPRLVLRWFSTAFNSSSQRSQHPLTS